MAFLTSVVISLSACNGGGGSNTSCITNLPVCNSSYLADSLVAQGDNVYIAAATSDNITNFYTINVSTAGGKWFQIGNTLSGDGLSFTVSDTHIYAASSSYITRAPTWTTKSEVYQYDDKNKIWGKVGDDIPDFIRQIAATNDAVYVLNREMGTLYQSTTNNPNFELIPTPNNRYIRSITTSQNNLYIATDDGYVYRKTPTGWNMLGGGSYGYYSSPLQLIVNNDNVYVNSNGDFIYASFNNSDWTVVGGTAERAFSSFAVVGNNVYASAEDYLKGYPIFVSQSGSTWNILSKGLFGYLAGSENNLYMAVMSSSSLPTPFGVYKFNNGIWTMIGN